MSPPDGGLRGQFALPSPEVIRRFLGVFGVDALVRASGVLLLPVYLRVMGQTEFGVYAYLNAVAAALALVLGFGLYAAQGKLYYDYPEHDRPAVLFTVNLLLALLLGVTVSAVCLSGLDLALLGSLLRAPSDAGEFRWPVLAGVMSSILSLHLLSYLYLRERVGAARMYNIARIVCMNAVALGALLVEDGDAAARRLAYAYSTELALTVVFFAACRRDFRVRFVPSAVRSALGIGLPIVASGALGIVANLSDRYFIEQIGTRQDLAVYGLAITLSTLVPMVFGSFQNLWLPLVLKQGSASQSRDLTARAILPLFISLFALSVLTSAIFAVLLRFGVVESDYQRTLSLLPLTFASAVLASMSGMYTNLMLKAGSLALIAPVSLVAAGAGVTLNLWLVPALGVTGAAVSSLAVNAVFLLCYRLRGAR